MSYLIEEFDDGNSELIAIEDADDDVDVSDLEIEDAEDADAEEVSEEDFTDLVDRIKEVIGNCENKDDLGDALLDVLINDFDYTAEDFEDIDDEDISDFEALAFEDEDTGDEDAKDADADANAGEKNDKTAENDDVDECKLTEKGSESGTELDEGKVGDWIKDKAEDIAYGIEDAATAIHRATPWGKKAYEKEQAKKREDAARKAAVDKEMQKQRAERDRQERIEQQDREARSKGYRDYNDMIRKQEEERHKRYEEEEDRKYKEWKYRSNGDAYYSGEWRSDYPNANSSYSDYKRYH